MTATLLRPTPCRVGSMAVFATGAAVCVGVDDPVARGLAIGLTLGIVNLWVGLAFLDKLLRSREGDVMIHIAAGFGARLVVLLAMLGVVAATSAVSAPAFGFSFLALVFVYYGIEIAFASRMQRGDAR